MLACLPDSSSFDCGSFIRQGYCDFQSTSRSAELCQSTCHVQLGCRPQASSAFGLFSNGTCASHGMESITDKATCELAASALFLSDREAFDWCHAANSEDYCTQRPHGCIYAERDGVKGAALQINMVSTAHDCGTIHSRGYHCVCQRTSAVTSSTTQPPDVLAHLSDECRDLIEALMKEVENGRKHMKGPDDTEPLECKDSEQTCTISSTQSGQTTTTEACFPSVCKEANIRKIFAHEDSERTDVSCVQAA